MNLFAPFFPVSGGFVRSALLASYLGRIETIEAIILIAGVLLLVIELFVPDFGLAGGAGIVLLLIGIGMTAGSPLEALALILVLIVLVGIMLLLLLRSARKGHLARNVILHLKSSRDHGYRSTEDNAQLVGCTGIALTDLRPAGLIEVDGKRFDVVTQGGFIQRGTSVKVIQAIGRRIVVEAAPRDTGIPAPDEKGNNIGG